MTAWLAIGIAGLLAYVMQLVPPLLSSRDALPLKISELSRQLGPAVIAALLASSLASNADGAFPFRNVVAIAFGLGVARRTRSIPYTVVSGLLVYAALGAVT